VVTFHCSGYGYDPFMNAKKQLAELFSPTTPSTRMINSMMTTPNTNNSNVKSTKTNNDVMSKSLISPKTPQPIPKMQSNFRRTSSLRISNRKPKPSVYTPPVRSNVHCGITDEGPISPSFVKATDYDELPIKSPYSAIKLSEKSPPPPQLNQPLSTALPVSASPSPTLPTVSINSLVLNKPIMREKGGALFRKNLKLDLKNPHMPSSDYPLSKTDSLALFLKYENDLANEMSDKERKDKSNNLSKRSATLNSNFTQKDPKLPDIFGRPLLQKASNGAVKEENNSREENELITIDKLNMNAIHSSAPVEADDEKDHSTPVKLADTYNNLPLLNDHSGKSRSPSLDNRASPEKSNETPSIASRRMRRQMKYNMDNILFDTDPSDVKAASTPPNSIDNNNSSNSSNNNSLTRPESRASNTESIFEDFDFDQFIASFTDDEKFPIFKDYKMLLNKSVKADEENNNSIVKGASQNEPEHDFKASKPISIQQSPQQQQQQQQHAESGMEKLDNLCKILAGNCDSDDSNTDPNEAQTARSKSSADSAYGRCVCVLFSF
jgi:hypothetical protein